MGQTSADRNSLLALGSTQDAHIVVAEPVADQAHPSSGKVKNTWSFTSTALTLSFIDA
jgi:hypothetical protein